MVTILPFISGVSTFNPADIAAMSAALDDVCAALALAAGDRRGRETVAVRIIELARRGERDATHLRDRVLREATGEPAPADGDGARQRSGL